MSKLLIFINILALVFCSNRFLLEEDKAKLNITLRHFNVDIIGKKGTLVLYAVIPTIFPINYEKKILFEGDVSNKYKTDCGVWYDGKVVYIFCNVDESVPAGEHELNLDGISFEYKEYIFTLVKTKDLIFKKIDLNVIDLYSDENIFYIEKEEKEDKKTYNLRFNISSYNKEKIYLSDYYIIDNCKQENNELICPVSRNQLIDSSTPIPSLNYSFINLEFLNSNYILKKFPLVPNIILNYRIPKEDIFIGINKLIQKIGDGNSHIVYETNVTNIVNIKPDLSGFTIPFQTEDGVKTVYSICTFRKYDITPLLLLCRIQEGIYKLSEFKEEKIVDKINTRYNFRIQPPKNNELAQNNGGETCTFAISVYPEILDFTKNNTLTVEYFTLEPYLIKGITFNENANDLSCEVIGEIIKCSVPKSHFNGKKSGYYFTKQRNINDGKSILYEIPPIKVILSGNSLSFSLIYLLLFLILIIF